MGCSKDPAEGSQLSSNCPSWSKAVKSIQTPLKLLHNVWYMLNLHMHSIFLHSPPSCSFLQCHSSSTLPSNSRLSQALLQISKLNGWPAYHNHYLLVMYHWMLKTSFPCFMTNFWRCSYRLNFLVSGPSSSVLKPLVVHWLFVL